MTDLSTLLSLDPLSCTDAQLDEIIAEFRARRAQFQAGLAPTKKPTAKAAKTVKELEGLSLEDLLK